MKALMRRSLVASVWCFAVGCGVGVGGRVAHAQVVILSGTQTTSGTAAAYLTGGVPPVTNSFSVSAPDSTQSWDSGLLNASAVQPSNPSYSAFARNRFISTINPASEISYSCQMTHNASGGIISGASHAEVSSTFEVRFSVLSTTVIVTGSSSRFAAWSGLSPCLMTLAREGQTVMPGTPLFRINGTDTLWLEAAIPQANAMALRPGTPVEAVVSAAPGQTFVGEVEALLPLVDTTSRTQRARIVLRNPGNVLAPGMFAEVTLQPQDGVAVPLVPTEALIATGADSRVIVQDADGGFRPVRVRAGRSSGGRTEILAGLTGREKIVVSGQFLIDSEASLSGALERLNSTSTQPAPTTSAPMPSMPMGDRQ